MVAITDIKADLPDWPDDVIEQWLLKFANQSEMGWPPPDPMEGHRWEVLITHPILVEERHLDARNPRLQFR